MISDNLLSAMAAQPGTDVCVVTCGVEWTIGAMEGSGKYTRTRHLLGGGIPETGSLRNCQ